MLGPTKVIHLRNMKPGDVYIGRAGHGYSGELGNPFKLNKSDPSGRDKSIQAFRIWFNSNVSAGAGYREKIFALKGKNLACFCAPEACHGDVYVDFLEGVHDECRCGWGAGPPPTGFKVPARILGPDGLMRCSACWWVPKAAQGGGFERWQ